MKNSYLDFTPSVEMKKNSFTPSVSVSRKFNPLLPVIILVLVVLSVGGYFLWKAYSDKKISSAADKLQISSEETKKMVNAVSRHLMLPEEEPKVLTLSNIETLKKEQPFFASAKDGDVILVYSQKVVIYDPRADRVVDIAQIRMPPQTTANPIPTPAERIYSVLILNGTGDEDIAKNAEKIINDIPNLKILASRNAKRKDYQKTLIMNMKEADAATLSVVSEKLSGFLSKLPSREATPPAETDILVILGREGK